MMKLSMMLDAYGWHCFARSVSRSRSKVKVICILQNVKTNHIKSTVQSLLMELSKTCFFGKTLLPPLTCSTHWHDMLTDSWGLTTFLPSTRGGRSSYYFFFVYLQLTLVMKMTILIICVISCLLAVNFDYKNDDCEKDRLTWCIFFVFVKKFVFKLFWLFRKTNRKRHLF
jgi:hypothetical protein